MILGEKISPIEVDAVLLSHPDISQAVAFGVPDDKYGEEVRSLFHIFIYKFLIFGLLLEVASQSRLRKTCSFLLPCWFCPSCHQMFLGNCYN